MPVRRQFLSRFADIPTIGRSEYNNLRVFEAFPVRCKYKICDRKGYTLIIQYATSEHIVDMHWETKLKQTMQRQFFNAQNKCAKLF